MTRVPLPTVLWMASSPPCRSITERASAMPSPVPCGLVVKKRSNIRDSVSSLIPRPVSSMITVTVRVSAA